MTDDLVRVRSFTGNTISRLFVCLFFGVCWLTADSVNADILVTDVLDRVYIQDTGISPPFFKNDSGTDLMGQVLEMIEGTGDFNTGGYQSRQTTSYSSTSLSADWRQQIPSAASIHPFAFMQGTSSVTFTANSDSKYTAMGIDENATGNLNSHVIYRLKNTTTNTVLFDGFSKWLDGSQSHNVMGSLTGDIVAGNQYEWMAGYEISKYADNSGFGGRIDASAGLNFSPVPEPSSVAIIGLAGLGVILRRRRR